MVGHPAGHRPKAAVEMAGQQEVTAIAGLVTHAVRARLATR